MNYQELHDKTLKIQLELESLEAELETKENFELYTSTANRARYLIEQLGLALFRIIEDARANSN